ncbi:glycosyl hydrolase [Demequina muriae]|uniref:glucan endo-1,3-beta-D-glucosidase n=1 Tax=Demequina muriae TaxID=3051664 RepID=A0ABT8GH86_9MICO|nr:glycosyl hydrolase [Demequina sp. EGI L300058]MDN4480780.1 glycosyl hydrolase [Demequina sp. EGI L300058]
MSVRRTAALTVCAAMAAGASACAGGGDVEPAATTTSPVAVHSLPERPLPEDVVTRVADDLAPPTNRWYSSLAFGASGLPVFPKPLAVTAADGGFGLGLTAPEASADVILAPARTDIAVSIAGAEGPGVVTAADPVAVTVTWGDASMSLAQGWPAVGLTAHSALESEVSVAFAPAGGKVSTAAVDGRVYGVVVDGGDIDGTTLTLDEGGTAQFFAVPDGGDATAFADALGDVVTAVAWSGWAGEDVATTSLDYGTPTVVTMPQARADGAELKCDLGTYATINGPYAVCRAQDVAWDVAAVAPRAALDLDGLTDAERTAIRKALAEDVAAQPELPVDTYFGAKALSRLATLLTIARALDEEALAEDLASVLSEQLRMWGDPERCATETDRCFVYDSLLEGVVGYATAFGSEEFNDHHFHYGYLLHAAAVLGSESPEIVDEIGPVMDLLAADIAHGVGGPMPAIRAFDPVEGHSWASGFSPFADGNNQESSSEAVAAWNAVALWAQVRGDATLEERARWLLASEADAARRLWLAPDLTSFSGFDHTIVALQWGAKRDYATWFSPEPNAMLGIQLIPASPAQAVPLAQVGPERIEQAVAEAAPHGFDVQFGDYLLMYRALAGDSQRTIAWEQARSLPATAIDDGNSRTAMLAWIAAAP